MKKLLVAVTATAALAIPATAPAHTAAKAKPQTIVQIAGSNKRFSTLVSLLKKAGLVTALSGKGQFTVFAPTNAAFNKVPKATLKFLATHPAALKKVLLYHVVAGKVLAKQVVTLHSVTTLDGERIAISVKRGAVYLTGASSSKDVAKVTTPNIVASNGVIHVINAVLVPKKLM